MNHKPLLTIAIISTVIISCTKENISNQDTINQPSAEIIQKKNYQPESATAESSASATAEYVTYIIRRGQHYSNLRPLKTVNVTEMKFFAKFNQTAIYQTLDPDNQYDINKLWGFSEGFNNQYNSARIGWGYSNGAIRLYGYAYSRGVLSYREITTVLPASEIYCSIKISGSSYIFSANGISVTLPRGTTATRASGLQQYPYFGGDEVAPHDIYIFIKPV